MLDLRGLYFPEDTGNISGASLSRFMPEIRFICSRAVGNIGNLEGGDDGNSAADSELITTASFLPHQGVSDEQEVSGESHWNQLYHTFGEGCIGVGDQAAEA